MDEIFKEAIKQSPALALMVIIVRMFLAHLRSLMDSHAKRTDEFIAAVKEMKEEDRQSRDGNTIALTNLGTEITRLSTIAENHRNGS